MDALNALTDDQTALIACAAALLVSGGLLWLSLHLGRFFARDRLVEAVPEHAEVRTVPLQPPQASPPHRARRAA